MISEVNPADPSTWTIATLANTAGTAGFADGAAATAQFREPTGLYLDAATHTLYIADTGNHAIRALDLQSKMVTTVVNTSHSLGFAGDGGPATAALLYRPTALTRCPNGDLFIADTGNNRIRRVTAGTITTVLGDGVPRIVGRGRTCAYVPGRRAARRRLRLRRGSVRDLGDGRAPAARERRRRRRRLRRGPDNLRRAAAHDVPRRR